MKHIYLSDCIQLVKLFVSTESNLYINDDRNVIKKNIQIYNNGNFSLPKILITSNQLLTNNEKYDYIFQFSNEKNRTEFIPNDEFKIVQNKNLQIEYVINTVNSSILDLTSLKTNFNITKTIIQASKLNFLKFINKSLTLRVFTNQNHLFKEITKSTNSKSYSFIKENEKFKLVLHNNRKTVLYSDIANNALDKLTIKAEKQIINRLKNISEIKNYLPNCINNDNDQLLIKSNKKISFSNIFLKRKKNKLFLVNAFEQTKKVCSIGDSHFWENLNNNLKLIENRIKSKSEKRLFECLEQLKKNINTHNQILICLSNPNFYNKLHKNSNGKITIPNWKESTVEAPALYDFYAEHFNKKPYKQSFEIITKLLNTSLLNKIIRNYNLDVELYYDIALLRYIAYHFATYLYKREDSNLLKVKIQDWETLLFNRLNTTKDAFINNEFIESLNEFTSSLNYAQLKTLNANTSINIVTSKINFTKINSYINKNQFVSQINIIKHFDRWEFNLTLLNKNQIKLICINEIKYKKFLSRPIDYFIISSYFRNSKSDYDTRFEIENIFLNRVIGQSNKPDLSIYSYIDKDKALRYINSKYDLCLQSIEDEISKNDIKAINNSIKSLPCNNFENTIKKIFIEFYYKIENTYALFTKSKRIINSNPRIIRSTETKIQILQQPYSNAA